MMAALWGDALDDIASARLHFSEAIAMFKAPDFERSGPDYLRRMAFQHAMQAGYTSFESALKRIFAMLGEPLPLGADWHFALLRRASNPLEGVRPAILGSELSRAATELMRFRHVAMHAYDRFDVAKAALALRDARAFLAVVDEDVARFRSLIDPPEF